ncbi:MAG: type IV pilus assembly protein PilM [Patescibacteria group bacterium]
MKPFSFPSIGVDISDESFKFLNLGLRHGRRKIIFSGEHTFKKGSIESGEIIQSDDVIQTLKTALHPYRKTHPYIILSLPEEHGFLRRIKMQTVPQEEIRQALEFQLEDHIPIAQNELYFDFQVLPHGKKDTTEMNIALTAYPKKIVDAYINVIQKAGFIPIVCELESQAIARAVVPSSSIEAVIVGDIGRTRTTFSIVYRGIVQYTSTIKVGGRDIDLALQESLQVSPQKASEIKIDRGLDFSSEEIIKGLSHILTALEDEAKKHINYWEHLTQTGEPQITKIYLCGGDAHLKGLPEFLATELNLPVERADIWNNIFKLNQYIPPMSAHMSLQYGTALGLTLRGGGNVFESHHEMSNLLPENYKADLRFEVWRRFLIFVGAYSGVVGVIATILLLPSYFFLQFQIGALESQFSSMKSNETYTVIQRGEKEVDSVNNVVNAFMSFEGAKPKIVAPVEDLLGRVVPGIVLNTFLYNEMADNTAQIKIGGTAIRRDIYLQYINNLQKSSFVKTKIIPTPTDLVSEAKVAFDLPFVISLSIQ